MTVVVALARWVEYSGLLGFVGVVVVRVLAGHQPLIRWARPRMDLALGAAFIGGMFVLGLQWFSAGSIPFVVVLRVAAEAAALVLCRTIGRGAVPAGFVAAVVLALGGHAVDAEPPIPAILVDALHVVSAGAWAGGIITLAALHPPDGWVSGEGRAMLQRFGGVAAIAFAVTALTGVLRATETLGDIGLVWTSGYGLVLLAKTAGVVAMLAMSAVTWRRGVPLARAEAALALAVLAATAVLAALPLPPLILRIG